MKILLSLLLSVSLFTFSAQAQYVNVPDLGLKSHLMGSFPDCFNASGMLDTTCAATKTRFFPSDLGSMINDWEGFQYFKNADTLLFDFINFSSWPAVWPAGLKQLSTGYSTVPSVLPALPNGLLYLSCSGANLTSVGTLPPNLITLDCSNNPSVHSLGNLPTSLTRLNCSGDSLFSLPALPSTITWLDCAGTLISSLPTLPPQLTWLDCRGNSLTSLPALPASLQYIYGSDNHFSVLPTLPSSLIHLDCSSSQLTSLPVLPASLQTLNCMANQLTSLPALPSSLLGLICTVNQLTSLPALPPGLRTLNCNVNQITSLPTLPDSLGQFICDDNPISVMPALPSILQYFSCGNCNLYSLPALPPILESLGIQGNHISCLPYLPAPATGLSISMDDQITCVANFNYSSITVYHPDNSYTVYNWSNRFPLCSAINNVNHCDAFPVMAGHVFNDNNNNLIKDANEPYRPNVKIQLSNGAFTFTNSNGYYQLVADSIGSYTTTLNPPTYFAAVPSQNNYNFSVYDTLVTNDFAFQATSTVDSLTILINPINAFARLGQPFPYAIWYENSGTTTLSPGIVFNYDNTRLIYDSCSNLSVTNNGSSLSLSEPGFVSGMQNNFIAYFHVNPTAVINDTIRANASISGGAASNTCAVATRIRGPFDPNDKTATPSLSPNQVMNGDYIDYSIRFQNVGNDTAFNVVIADTLNSFLQANSLQVISTSHPCKTTVKDNIVYFEFLNILLPDSNVNQFKSHGYVNFRIKPQSNLVINNIIPNKAAIYFDYNSPVITNTAVTTIIDPSTVPLKLLSFIVNKGTGSTANVYWQTSNEINVIGYNIEMSIDGRNYRNIVFEKAKGDQYDSYTRPVAIPNNDILYFRLKMTDIDGNYSYSNIAILKNDRTNAAFSFLNNPVKDELIVSVNDADLKNTTAKIFNAQGALVKTILLQHDVETIDIKSLSAGTYYLVTGKGSRQFMIIK